LINLHIKHASGSFSARLYRGLGPVLIETARGEVKAMTGDLIAEIEGETTVLTPRVAMALLGESAKAHLTETLSGSLKDALALTVSEAGKLIAEHEAAKEEAVAVIPQKEDVKDEKKADEQKSQLDQLKDLEKK
jgi:hypothetical protein